MDLEYKTTLFNWMTLRLLAHKYAYYILNDEYIKDITYDLEEKHWYEFGRELRLLKEDETSPCVDFDENHSMAPDAAILANYYINIYGSNPKIEDLFKRYKQD
jgi:hypothetical protein